MYRFCRFSLLQQIKGELMLFLPNLALFKRICIYLFVLVGLRQTKLPTDVAFKRQVSASGSNKYFFAHFDLMWNKITHFLCGREIHPDLPISDLGQLGEEEPAVPRCWCRETCARTRRVFLQRAFAC